MTGLPSTVLPSSYVEVEGDALANLDKTAAHLLGVLKDRLGPRASYGPLAVKWLADDLDQNRARYNTDEKLGRQILWMYGAFLGKAIVESSPRGRVAWVDNRIDNVCLKVVTMKNQVTFAAPFTKVAKHLANGVEDSIYAFFVGLDEIVRNGFPAGR